MTLHIYWAINSQNGMISGVRNRQKMKVSGRRKHHYGPGFFSGPRNHQNGTISGPEIFNMTKRNFLYSLVSMLGGIFYQEMLDIVQCLTHNHAVSLWLTLRNC